MKNLTDWFRNNWRHLKFYGMVLIAGLVGTWYTYNYAIAFSDYAIALLFVTLFIGLFHWFDMKVLSEIDTMDELKGKDKPEKQGNVAYAIFLHAIAVLMLAVAVIVG